MDNKRYVGWPSIHDAVNRISFEMYKDNWRPDYIVGLTRGGLIPAVVMSHTLDVPMHALKVSLRDHVGEDHDSGLSDLAATGANILVLDDINDTGATLNWIVNDWKLNELPRHNVKFAVLFDNLSSGFQKEVDYCDTEINKAEKDEWIVFPWEH